MFKIPPDIEHDLMKKYPNVDIVNLIHDLFNMIIQKSCFVGSCPIRGFGKFIAFKIFSSRLGHDTMRFKFKHSVSFMNRIKNDNYIVNNLAIHAKHEFTDKHEKKCNPVKKTNLTNVSALIVENTKVQTNYKMATNEILNILESDN